MKLTSATTAARTFLLVSLLLGVPFAVAQSNVVYLGPAPGTTHMTVQDVIKLSKAGLSDDLIIEQIRKKNQRFDLSTDQLLQLKAASVSERIIAVMIDPAHATAPTTAPAVTPRANAATESAMKSNAKDDTNNSLPTEIGVYVKHGKSWTEVLPEVVNWKTGGVAKSIATVGIVKGDLNGHVNGASSHNQFATPIQFLIVVPDGTAVTEYQLLRLHQHGDNREFRTVTGGVLHVSGGATRDLLPYDSTKVASRTYRVNLSLGDGQYGFLPPGAFIATNAAASMGKIYSFKVIE